MYIPRYYQNLEQHLQSGKVLVIYGPRQAGKTTLVEHFLNQTNLQYRYETGDNIRVQEILSSQDLNRLLEFTEGQKLLVIDEAQYISNIGMGLKMIIDKRKDIKIIATGSSSFDLANQLGEPLTGRKRTLKLYPFAQLELKNQANTVYDLKQNLEKYLVFGSYPEVITAKNKKGKQLALREITESYLLKDILTLENIKASRALVNILELLAFQIGNEVSHHELGQQVGLDKNTVARYLDLLEKTFVLINVRGFSRNLRKEISKKSKYYFYDTGVRNAIINNFNKLRLRNDTGQLWENFLVIERLKKQEYHQLFSNNYFWRTYDQKEIDWIEEREGQLYGYEFKWGNKTPSAPKDWQETYDNAHYKIINRQNYPDFIL